MSDKNSIDINSITTVKNPLKSYHSRAWKDSITYSYSGPIDGCTILDQVITQCIYSVYKKYDYYEVMSFLDMFNLYPKDIYIIKYDFDYCTKIDWVITFNNSDYVWVRKFNKSDKGGDNHLIMTMTGRYGNYNMYYSVYDMMEKYYKQMNEIIIPNSLSELLFKNR